MLLKKESGPWSYKILNISYIRVDNIQQSFRLF
jgi:hypothetical protein